jgi:hypothetical protein
VESFDNADITDKRLALGDENVHFYTRIDDNSSWFRSVLANRQQRRRQLATLTERDLHDVGLSWSDIVFEAEKPFWRA